MKLSKLIPGDTFKTDTGIKFQVLLMNKAEKKKYKEHLKCRRIDSGETYFLNKDDRIRIQKI